MEVNENIYNQVINNPEIVNDYFESEDINIKNLEELLHSSSLSLTNKSMVVKLNLLSKLKINKLDIYNYFDILESYFNKYYYGIELINKEEEKINNYF